MARAGGIPEFDDSGNLPPGAHCVSFAEIEGHLAWNEHRRALLGGLRRAKTDLSAAGVRWLVLAGSFVSSRWTPRDVDGFWVCDASVERGKVDPVLLDELSPRTPMRRKYGVDFLICWTGMDSREGQGLLRFFGRDREGNARGVLLIDLTEAT